MSFEKQAIFSLIDVSGSMEDAYSKNYSNSKIESLTETIRNIIFSENLLGSEKDIDFYSLIFGASKLNDWLNALVLLNIAIDNIVANPFQPRKKFDEENLKSLAESIKRKGVLQPVLVVKIDNGKYQLVAGERRFRATASFRI